MGEIADRVRATKRDLMTAAFERWVTSWRERQQGEERVAAEGPGAGDTKLRRTQFTAREALKRARPGLAFGLERRIGPTLDLVPFAPSDLAQATAQPVARIVEWEGVGIQPVGVATGFLVSPRLLLTNHHVIPRDFDARRLAANFLHATTERGVAEGIFFQLDPDLFYASHEGLDFALVGIQPRGTRGEPIEDLGSIRLIEANGKILTGHPVNIIQHPAGGPRQFAVRNNRLTHILETEGFLHYETDTLEGSSGSPVFNRDWELIGLHHCGIPAMRGEHILKRDGEPWDPLNDSDDEVDWVANEGTRVSFIVSALRAKRLPPAPQELLNDLLDHTADPVVGQEASGAAGRAFNVGDGGEMGGNVFNISGGTVNITIGARPANGRATVDVTPQASLPAASPAAPQPARAIEKAQNFDPDYASRVGYEASFLGVEVPMPRVVAGRHAELYTVGDYKTHYDGTRNVPEVTHDGLDDDDALPIPYYHYSLIVNKQYRMPMLTASNVDYREEARSDPRNRADFGGESWRLDRRVPRAFQLTDADIYKPAGNFDRGHVVRREDNCWGDPGLPTEYANADTYHWTNCTPQHELFNQETPDGEEYRGRTGIWGAFEETLAQQVTAGGGQAVIFAGPVLHAGLPSEDFGAGEVKYPLKFWKVVVVPETTARRPKLLAYGFVFDQSRPIREFGLGLEAKVVLTQFSRQRATLREIAELAGVTFAASLHDVDQHR